MANLRYQALGPLLSGGSSRAFLGLEIADDTHAGPVVFIWVPEDVTLDTERINYILRETERAALLEHPHITRVFGLVSLEEGVARVVEFADGEGLRRILEVVGQLPMRYAVRVVLDAASGVHYAHVAGNDDGTPLVHGDIRPETALVTHEGVTKISGYGALSVAPKESGSGGSHGRGQQLHCAPEQILGGRETMNRATDVYQLGIVLFECITGTIPFESKADFDQAVLNDPVPALPGTAAAELNEVLRKALAKRAADRYSTAHAFRDALALAAPDIATHAELAVYLRQNFPEMAVNRNARHKAINEGLAEFAPNAQGPSRPSGPPLPPDPPRRSLRSGSASPSPVPPPQPSSPRSAAAMEGDPVDPDEAAAAEAAEAALAEEAAEAAESRPPERGAWSAAVVRDPAEMEEGEDADDDPSTAKTLPPMPVAPPPTGRTPKVPPVGVAEERKRPPKPTSRKPPRPMVADVTDPRTAVPKRSHARVFALGAGILLIVLVVARLATPNRREARTDAASDSTSPAAEQSGVVGAGPGELAAPQAVPMAPVPTSPAASAPAAPPPKAAVPPTLSLTSNPPLDVYVEGKALGRTPLTVPMPAGEHNLQLADKALGISISRAVNIRSAGSTSQHVNVGKGSVVVSAPDGAVIFIDGIKKGVAPIPEFPIYEGAHRISVLVGKARWSEAFKVRPTEKMTFNVHEE